MTDVSSRRRRLGIAAITTTALALPLTASITYAQDEMPQPPAPPEAPLAPEAPLPPVAPLPPQAPEAPSIESIDPDDEHVYMHIEETEDGGERRVTRRVVRNGVPLSEAEIEAMMERIEADMEGREAEIEMLVENAMEHAEHAQELGEHARKMGEHAHRLAMRAPQVQLDCDDVDESGVIERDLGDGRRALVICESIIRESASYGIEGAVIGLRTAIQEIRRNRDIPAAEREELIQSLQQAIEEMQRETRTMSQARVKARQEARASAQAAEATRTAAAVVRWQGQMVSPVQVRATLRMTPPPAPPAPLPPQARADTDADCDESGITRA